MLTSRLGVFVRRVSGPQFRAILENLCVSVLSAEDEQRDIASLALRTAMAQVAADDALAEETARTVVPALAAQVRSLAASVAQQNDALDILADALEHFAATVTTDAELHTVVLEALLAALESRHSSVSRRAVNVLALFATECQPDAYETILGRGLAPLQAGAPWQRSRTAVQLCGLLARDTPRRLRSEAPRLVDAMLHIAQAAQAAQGEEADNVLESALQSIGLVLAHCVPASGMNVGGALECALALLQYDPNYAGYEEDEMDEEDDEEDDELVHEGYSDDDDFSWKVRRAAARLLATLFTHHMRTVEAQVPAVARVLVARFAEREESVRLEVLATFSMLLLQAPGATEVDDAPELGKRKWAALDQAGADEALVPALEPLLPSAVGGLCRQAVSRSTATRIASIDALAQLANVFGPRIAPSCAAVFDAAQRALHTSDASHGRSLWLATVALFRALCVAAPAQVLGQLGFVVDTLVQAIEGANPRAALEGLHTASQLVRSVFPLRLDAAAGEVVGHLERIYDADAARLQRPDSDQTLREACIDNMAVLLSAAGDHLGARLDTALATLRERLTSEVTYASCTAALQEVVQSPRVRDRPAVVQFAAACIDPLLAMSRLSDAAKSARALESLRCIVVALQQRVPQDAFARILGMLEAAVQPGTDGARLATLLHLATLLVQTDAALTRRIVEQVLPPAAAALASPMLPAAALEALTALMRAIAARDASLGAAAAGALLRDWDRACAEQARQAHLAAFLAHAPAAYAGSIGAAAGASPAAHAVALDRAVAALHAGDEAEQALGLCLLGALGQQRALAREQVPAYFDAALRAEADSDARSAAAAYALGGLMLCDTDTCLPPLLSLVGGSDERSAQRALRALREALLQADDAALRRLTAAAWPPLLAFGERAQLDEAQQGVYDACCECLARMVFTDPEACVAQLERAAHSTSAVTRVVVLGTVRSALTLDRSHALDVVLSQTLWRFLTLMDDEHLAVRRLAVFTLHAALYNRPELVREHLAVLLPKLYHETVAREELKRKVPMGPFTVTIDDGLDVRKNAFEAIFTLLDTCLEHVDTAEGAWCDAADELTPSAAPHHPGARRRRRHQGARLPDARAPHGPRAGPGRAVYVPRCALPLTADLDEISRPLQAIMNRKVRDNATKQEVEKVDELILAAVRVLVRLELAAGPVLPPEFAALVQSTLQSPHAPAYRRIAAELK